MPRPRKSKLFDNSQFFIPRRTVQGLDSLEKVCKAFALPANASWLSQENRMAMDSAFDAVGGGTQRFMNHFCSRSPSKA